MTTEQEHPVERKPQDRKQRLALSAVLAALTVIHLLLGFFGWLPLWMRIRGIPFDATALPDPKGPYTLALCLGFVGGFFILEKDKWGVYILGISWIVFWWWGLWRYPTMRGPFLLAGLALAAVFALLAWPLWRAIRVEEQRVRQLRFDEQQLQEIKRQFARRRSQQRVATGLVVVVFIAMMPLFFLSGDSKTSLENPAHVLALLCFLPLFGALAFSYVNWRCPACNRWLGKQWNPDACVDCKTPLK